jgi:hypothetical protein
MSPFTPFLRRIGSIRRNLRGLPGEIDVLKRAVGRSLVNQNRDLDPQTLFAEVEFSIYSQFGDDGIIQFLLRHVPIPKDRRTFVEFGVEDYREANTRFLLVNDNWRGMILDGSARNMARVRKEAIYWRHDLTAVAAFIDRDNINGLLKEQGFVGEIGLLHIDIDGNDYWVWERLTVVNPIIVILEFNNGFGATHAITIPYDPSFVRTRAHHSNLYYGASLPALVRLAARKGYAFVGCNQAGNNAYFVRRDALGLLPERSVEEGYVKSHIRESRDAAGALTFLSRPAGLRLIGELPVVDVETGKTVRIRDLLGDHAGST